MLTWPAKTVGIDEGGAYPGDGLGGVQGCGDARKGAKAVPFSYLRGGAAMAGGGSGGLCAGGLCVGEGLVGDGVALVLGELEPVEAVGEVVLACGVVEGHGERESK